MGIFSGIIRRSNSDRHKLEDTALIYTGKISPEEVLKSNTYKNCEYDIITCGNFPIIRIRKNIEISINSGKNKVDLPDRNGKLQTVYRIDYDKGSKIEYYKQYTNDGDFVCGEQKGKKYTVDELETDCRTYIDAIIKNEDEAAIHF